MKDTTLGKIVIGGYLSLVLAYAGLLSNHLISNRLEDRTAVATAEVSKEDEGTIIDSSRGYVAFDKSGDGKVDEIKEYRRGMAGGRSLGSVPYTLRYHQGDRKFESIKAKYFSQN